MVGGTRVVDYQNRPIDLEALVLEQELPFPAASDQKRWDKFHLDYITEVGNIVGFRGINGKPIKLPKEARETFERIFREYHQNSILQEIFGTYYKFFHCFFTLPYGINNVDCKYYDEILPLLDEKAEANRDISILMDPSSLEKTCRALTRIEQIEEEVKRLKFIRKINLPKLLYTCLERYDKIPPQKPIKEGKKIVYNQGGRDIPAVLTPIFSTNLWDDIFSENDECIFISKHHEGDTTSLKFQKYWFASLLHCAHPRIRYINFVPDRVGIPNPLFRAKIMSGDNTWSNARLIVGGILGESFHRVKSGGIEEYIDSCIAEYSKQNSIMWGGGRVFYNFSHAPSERKPYLQFMKYIKDKYGIADDRSRTAPPWKMTRKTKMRVRWHHFIDYGHLISRISTIDKYGNNRYKGEQYSETFARGSNEGLPGAFCIMDGTINGYEIHHRKPLKTRTWNLIKFLVLCGAGSVVLTSVFGYYSKRMSQHNLAREYTFTRMFYDKSTKPALINGGEATKIVIVEHYDRPKRIVEGNLKHIEDQLNSMLKLYCDRLEFADMTFVPGGISPDKQFVCPSTIYTILGHKQYMNRKMDYESEFGEIVNIPLSDIASADVVRMQTPVIFRIYVPWRKHQDDVYIAPGVEIRTKSGKSHMIAAKAGSDWKQQIIQASDIVDMINSHIKHRK